MQPNWPSAAPAESTDDVREPDRGIRPIEAISFLFANEDAWTNLGIGFVFLIIPLVGPIALLGWQTEIFQRLARRHPRPIPKLSFSDFNVYIGKGVPAFLVQMLVAMPIGIGVGFIAGIANAMASFASAASRRGSHATTFDPTPIYIVLVVIGLLVLALIPLVTLVSNAATTRAEITQEIGPALQPGPLFAYLRGSLWPAMLGLFLYSFVATGAVMLGLVLCFIGLYPAIILVRVGMVHMRWQIYESYLARGGARIPLKLHPEPLPSEQGQQR
jgi:hypothetical protein